MEKAKWSALTDIFDSLKMHLCTDFSIIRLPRIAYLHVSKDFCP